MENYIQQLLSDIKDAESKINVPGGDLALHLTDIRDWVPSEEEDKTARIRNLEEWTGISKVQLPPAEMLSDGQLQRLLKSLKEMLDSYNCSFVLQTDVPERIQYAAVRDNFNQQVKVKRLHQGFFQLCREGTEHEKCALEKYCQCAFYAKLFAGFANEKLSAEEERAKNLAIEISYLKKKYGDAWMKYFPYHLDPDYDDENGNPHDYGFGDEEEDEDDWWR